MLQNSTGLLHHFTYLILYKHARFRGLGRQWNDIHRHDISICHPVIKILICTNMWCALYISLYGLCWYVLSSIWNSNVLIVTQIIRKEHDTMLGLVVVISLWKYEPAKWGNKLNYSFLLPNISYQWDGVSRWNHPSWNAVAVYVLATQDVSSAIFVEVYCSVMIKLKCYKYILWYD